MGGVWFAGAVRRRGVDVCVKELLCIKFCPNLLGFIVLQLIHGFFLGALGDKHSLYDLGRQAMALSIPDAGFTGTSAFGTHQACSHSFAHAVPVATGFTRECILVLNVKRCPAKTFMS
jgi:hypothetical protein